LHNKAFKTYLQDISIDKFLYCNVK